MARSGGQRLLRWSLGDVGVTSNRGAAPGTYSLEGYDAATVLLKGIDAGKTDRASLLAYTQRYEAIARAVQDMQRERARLQASLS